MIKFESFNLENDTGVTRMEEVGQYNTGSTLHREGWTLIGVCQTEATDRDGQKEQKIYGVFRLAGDEVMRKALADAKKAGEERDKAVTEKNTAHRQLDEMTARLAEANEAIRAHRADLGIGGE